MAIRYMRRAEDIGNKKNKIIIDIINNIIDSNMSMADLNKILSDIDRLRNN